MNLTNLTYMIACTQLNGIGPVKCKRILESFPDLVEFFVEKPHVIYLKTGINPKLIQQDQRKKAIDAAQAIENYNNRNKIQTYSITTARRSSIPFSVD